MSHARIKPSTCRVWLFSKRGKLKVRQHRKGLFGPLAGRNYFKKSRSHGICPMAHWHGMCTSVELFGCPASFAAGMRHERKDLTTHTLVRAVRASVKGIRSRCSSGSLCGGRPRDSQCPGCCGHCKQLHLKLAPIPDPRALLEMLPTTQHPLELFLDFILVN